MKTGQACIRSVVCIEAEASIREAARLMREHHVGNLVILGSGTDRQRPVGIITDRDLTVEVIAMEVDMDSVSAGDLFASPKLITAGVDEELEQTLEIMRRHGIRRVPVVEADGRLAGILALDDVVEILAEQLSMIVGVISRQPGVEARRRG
ncbi:CBS domain-containing protein [Gammaproteobacteria bacterium AB-CW1]|uniref:CBS domain-containing protein n=1 Tax=Natronospira elongata TaxID=3110268 RepID=A0AAP6MN11_9GAMM|nr:CBS domain-containing protein [Gammaproteobacteria bacterium AB-CW1]